MNKLNDMCMYFRRLTLVYIFKFIFVHNSFGLPTIDKVPDGFTPLAEVWGKGKNRDPLMVTFNHPSDW